MTRVKEELTGSHTKECIRADTFGVLRAPVLPPALLETLAMTTPTDLAKVVRTETSDPYVREAIYLASPSLYERLCAWENGNGEFNSLVTTIARYLLRMAFRATPFGTFSYVATVNFADGPSRLVFPHRNMLFRKIELDSTHLSNLARRIRTDSHVKAGIEYRPNDTILLVDNDVTFIAYGYAASGKRIYRRVRLESDSFLSAAIEAAKFGATARSIVASMEEKFNQDATREEIEEYVLGLVNEQVLCCDDLVDITSGDQLSDLISKVQHAPNICRKLYSIKSVRDSACGSGPVSVPDYYDQLARTIAAAGSDVKSRNLAKVDLYDIKTNSYTVDTKILRSAELALDSILTTSPVLPRLGRFINIFTERFGDSEVPLMIVAEELDSLGYLDRGSEIPPLARVAGIRPNSAALAERPQSIQIIDQVLDKFLQSDTEEYIDIQPFCAATAPPPSEASRSAVEAVAWLSLWKACDNEEPVVEIRSISSTDPGRFMGRFASGLPKIADYLMDRSELQGDVTCEIVHQPNDSLGNICSRPVTSSYELRIRGGDSTIARTLLLSDLVVSIFNGKVRIRSVSIDRYLTLRMSNAHAFDKQEHLPVYRFLNHVASQGAQVMIPSLRARLSNSVFVPGLKFDKVILSRPTWKVQAQALSALRKGDRESRRRLFAELRNRLRLPLWVALVQGDNVIPYNLDNEWMVDDLVRNLLRGDEAILTDVYPEKMVPYSSESFSRFHEIQFAFRRKGSALRPATRVVSTFRDAMSPVWGRWAYFNIYASPEAQDEILRRLKPDLEEMANSGVVEGYFFIRYRDSKGSHIRLRLRGTSDNTLASVVPLLSPSFAELDRSRLAQTISVEPYIREVSRYGGALLCEAVEQIFFADSRIALAFLSKYRIHAVHSWRTAAVAIDSMLTALGVFSLSDRFAFAKRASQDFDREQNYDSARRKRIGEVYREAPSLFINGCIDLKSPGAEIFSKSTDRISRIAKCSGLLDALNDSHALQAYDIRWSLVHMRLNRLFVAEPRAQEAVVWELLKRSYASVIFQGVHAK